MPVNVDISQQAVNNWINELNLIGLSFTPFETAGEDPAAIRPKTTRAPLGIIHHTIDVLTHGSTFDPVDSRLNLDVAMADQHALHRTTQMMHTHRRLNIEEVVNLPPYPSINNLLDAIEVTQGLAGQVLSKWGSRGGFFATAATPVGITSGVPTFMQPGVVAFHPETVDIQRRWGSAPVFVLYLSEEPFVDLLTQQGTEARIDGVKSEHESETKLVKTEGLTEDEPMFARPTIAAIVVPAEGVNPHHTSSNHESAYSAHDDMHVPLPKVPGARHGLRIRKDSGYLQEFAHGLKQLHSKATRGEEMSCKLRDLRMVLECMPQDDPLWATVRYDELLLEPEEGIQDDPIFDAWFYQQLLLCASGFLQMVRVDGTKTANAWQTSVHCGLEHGPW
ncbi:hypothetical protein GLOTRDRAFT_95196 [Gloeophyllum trabeum ATCC 11539]|uniref:Uncharacterized protein n=1 Tax=Gloeophyllum trabeum (strain ATCC 11539 / FP-39264 / Madison 617) TaxID=670483 RepID=S7Q0F8_GLOTA|nr:uncharacterized protein GLOTRDRAFT_95196 [Gloeophyllum trabeum ATCC 11539]EPQ53188.1 hypothetical protein GLOTRDRAFT_95196 [Gloeophyllum trabeum ATCC 11539]